MIIIIVVVVMIGGRPFSVLGEQVGVGNIFVHMYIYNYHI